MTIGIANIVTSARNRRSRTSRRLVDSPRTLWEACSSWIALAPWARAVVGRTVYSPVADPTNEHRRTPVRRTNGSVAGRPLRSGADVQVGATGPRPKVCYAREMTAAAPRTIVEKIWTVHVVTQDPG